MRWLIAALLLVAASAFAQPTFPTRPIRVVVPTTAGGVPDAATLAAWHEGLKPVTDSYLDGLAKSSFPGAHAAYRKAVELAR